VAETLKKREYGIDLLKSVSILGVIIIHTCTYGDAVLSSGWLSNVFWGSLTRASVPLFLMCSGTLFLRPGQPLSVKKLFSRSIPRILAAMVFWAMSYKIFHLLADGGFSLAALFQAVKEVLLFNQEFHLYYLQVILLVYLFLPVTDLLVQHAERRQVEYLLLLWFILGIVYPTVAGFWPFRLLDMMAPQYQINMTYASIGYGLLGFYLKEYPLGWRAGAVSAIIGFMMVFGGTVWMSARMGSLQTLFLQGMTVGVALLAAGLFSLCIHAGPPRGGRTERAVTYLSKGSFCIYLVHIYFNYGLPKLGFSAALFPPLAGVPLAALVTLGGSLVVYALLRRVPVVKSWLI
jgi:surface polysaccharide O-acyltransferase-like enzyme